MPCQQIIEKETWFTFFSGKNVKVLAVLLGEIGFLHFLMSVQCKQIILEGPAWLSLKTLCLRGTCVLRNHLKTFLGAKWESAN